MKTGMIKSRLNAAPQHANRLGKARHAALLATCATLLALLGIALAYEAFEHAAAKQHAAAESVPLEEL